MKEALTRLLSSSKFWTLVIGLAGALGARYGFAVDTDTMWMIAGLVGVLLGAQGLNDHGKGAVLAAAPPTPPTPIAAGSGPVIVPPASER